MTTQWPYIPCEQPEIDAAIAGGLPRPVFFLTYKKVETFHLDPETGLPDIPCGFALLETPVSRDNCAWDCGVDGCDARAVHATEADARECMRRAGRS